MFHTHLKHLNEPEEKFTQHAQCVFLCMVGAINHPEQTEGKMS